MQLVIVPVVLSLITVAFAWQQDTRQERTENQRAKAERELTVQRAQDEALQAYLDQMSTLLIERNLRGSEEASEVRTLARTRTLTVLKRLDPSRKTAVLQLLQEAELVQSSGDSAPIFELAGADLGGADLSASHLSGANLREADLSGADLLLVHLREAILVGADLRAVDLRAADLSTADLTEVNLTGADLREADLRSALAITNEQLE